MRRSYLNKKFMKLFFTDMLAEAKEAAESAKSKL